MEGNEESNLTVIISNTLTKSQHTSLTFSESGKSFHFLDDVATKESKADMLFGHGCFTFLTGVVLLLGQYSLAAKEAPLSFQPSATPTLDSSWKEDHWA